jgi:hypothetical protein
VHSNGDGACGANWPELLLHFRTVDCGCRAPWVLAQQGQNAPADSEPEKAIAAYEAALSVTTRAQLPDEWALTQNNLGSLLEPNPWRPGR